MKKLRHCHPMYSSGVPEPEQMQTALAKRCINVRQRRIDAENRNSRRGYDDDEQQQQKPVNDLGH